MAKRRIASLAVALMGLGLLTTSSLASPSSRATGHMEIRLNPCCSTLPVRQGQPPPHYRPRWVSLKNRAGKTVVHQRIRMSHWTRLAAPVGRYTATAQGCGSQHVRITTGTVPRVKLRCPVP